MYGCGDKHCAAVRFPVRLFAPTAVDALALARGASAHNTDLLAAQAVGFRTAFVYRTREYGPTQTTDLTPDPSVDVVARDFEDLADQIA